MKFTPITTPRLLLRPLTLADAKQLFAYSSDKTVNQYQGRIPEKLVDTKAFIQNLTADFGQDKTWFQLGIEEQKSNQLIGDIGIHFKDNSKGLIELGIRIDKDFHGNGFAKEALSNLMDFLKNNFGSKVIQVSVDPRNVASIQLFKSMNFERSELNVKAFELRGEWVDDAIYVKKL